MAKLERDATKRGKRAREAESGYAGAAVDGTGRMHNIRASKDGHSGIDSGHRCFACDGSGEKCGCCGEASGVCACAPDEKSIDTCDVCNGSGR